MFNFSYEQVDQDTAGLLRRGAGGTNYFRHQRTTGRSAASIKKGGWAHRSERGIGKGWSGPTLIYSRRAAWFGGRVGALRTEQEAG